MIHCFIFFSALIESTLSLERKRGFHDLGHLKYSFFIIENFSRNSIIFFFENVVRRILTLFFNIKRKGKKIIFIHKGRKDGQVIWDNPRKVKIWNRKILNFHPRRKWKVGKMRGYEFSRRERNLALCPPLLLLKMILPRLSE